MENTPFKWFQLPHLIKGLQSSTHILYYNPLLKKVTYGLPGSSYTLPTASGSVLGGVKIGTGLSIDGSGVLSVSSSYSLPIASSTVLGGIKIGSGLSIDPTTGVVTAAGTYSLPIASGSVLGGVKVGTGLSINSTTGVLTATGGSYSLPTASATVLGGIKIGTGLSIDVNGVVSATGGGSGGGGEDLQATLNIGSELLGVNTINNPHAGTFINAGNPDYSSTLSELFVNNTGSIYLYGQDGGPLYSQISILTNGASIELLSTNGSDTTSIEVYPTGTSLIGVRSYVSDAAADADLSLHAKGLYKINGSRALLQKP